MAEIPKPRRAKNAKTSINADMAISRVKMRLSQPCVLYQPDVPMRPSPRRYRSSIEARVSCKNPNLLNSPRSIIPDESGSLRDSKCMGAASLREWLRGQPVWLSPAVTPL